jgi:hypothetical protein
MIIPNIWKIKNVPNHQPDNTMLLSLCSGGILALDRCFFRDTSVVGHPRGTEEEDMEKKIHGHSTQK